MATAQEKQAKQDALDAQKSAVVQGQQRLQTEVTRAKAAFPVRRLRTAGDLSRYQVGGFLSDPRQGVGGVGGGAAPPPTPTPKPTGGSSTSGSGVSPKPAALRPPAGTLPPIGGRSGGGSSGGIGGAPGAYRPPAPGSVGGAFGALSADLLRQIQQRGSTAGGPSANRTLSGGAATGLSKEELAYINKAKGVKPTPAKGPAQQLGTGKGNQTLSGGAAAGLSKQELAAINKGKGATAKPKQAPAGSSGKKKAGGPAKPKTKPKKSYKPPAKKKKSSSSGYSKTKNKAL